MTDRKHPDAKCEECSWAEESDYAGGDGPADASIVFIGEAPGRVETRTGKPFNGPSGDLLNRVLSHYGIRRDGCYTTNIAACHPPYSKDQKSVAPPKDVIKACRPRLDTELSALGNLETVVAMGNTAAQTILGSSTGITKLRSGPPKITDLGAKSGIRVIPTVHPAACLRQGDRFPDFVKDIGKIKGSPPEWLEPSYDVLDTEKDAIHVMDRLCKELPNLALAVDIETGVDKDEDFGHPSELLCVGLANSPDHAFVVGEKALRSKKVFRSLAKLLDRAKIVTQNGKYDLPVLQRLGVTPEIPNCYFDTMLASYALDERGSGIHGLEFQAMEHLGSPSWKKELDKYISKGESYALIPRDVLYKYNAFDAINTFRLYLYWTAELDRDGVREVHDFLAQDAQRCLGAVESGGIGIDIGVLDSNTKELTTSLEAIEEELDTWVRANVEECELSWRQDGPWPIHVKNKPFNPKSWMQVKAALWSLGYKVESTDADTLEGLLERRTISQELREFLNLMLKHRKEAKLYGTYVKGIRQRLNNGRVYTTFLLHGTTSGRLSSRNPNLQNVPRGSYIKDQFVPMEGNIFVQADYAQAELRTATCESKDPYLRAVFSDPDRDIFHEVGASFYGVEGARDKANRVRIKAIVYGLGYGREAYSISQEYGITEKEAKEAMRAYTDLVPGLMQWRKWIVDEVLKHQRPLVNAFGRKRRFWLITRENRKDVIKEAYSYLPQSTVADLYLRASARIQAELERRSLGSLRILVHDSVLAECKKEDAEEVGHLIKTMLEELPIEVYSDFVPFDVEVETGPSWGQMSVLELA